jgi:hypothetical protein
MFKPSCLPRRKPGFGSWRQLAKGTAGAVAALAIVVCSVRVVAAADAVELRPRVPSDQTLTTQDNIKVDQSLDLNGQDLGTTAAIEASGEVVYGAPDADGNVKVERIMKKMLADLQLPGGLALKFDSTNPGAKPDRAELQAIVDLLKKQSETSLTYIVTPKFEVRDVVGLATALGANPENVRRTVEQDFRRFPDLPVRPGDAWERTEVLDLGSGQQLTFIRRFEYLGEKPRNPTVSGGPKLDRIAVKTLDVKLAIDPKQGLPATVTKSELKVKSSEGMILFDREAGYQVEETMKLNVAGPISLSLMGTELSGELDLTLDAKNTVAKR